MTYLTEQEIYNRAAQHLLTQKSTAVLPRGGAAYFGANGRCCPIGKMIPKGYYVSTIESVPVRYLSKPETEVKHLPLNMISGIQALRKALEQAKVDTKNQNTVSLLSKLQNVHDAFGNWEWKDRLASIAREHKLDATIIKTFK